MITFLTGVPGSGKTYKAVYTIFNNFSYNEKAKKDIKKDFINCYTNINEFKFDKVDHVHKLDFDDLKIKLTKLHKLYKEKVTDEVLIEKLKEFGIYKSLFVIDEAHNYFDSNDIVLIWWLSYHRHLFQDIYLITQNLGLIFTKYKTFSEFFYRAKSTTVSLDRNTFKYDVYINSRLAMNARSHTEKLPKIKEVFELYQSGDSVSTKNILLKFYVFSFFMIVSGIVFAYFYFATDSKSHVDKNIAQIQTSAFVAPAQQLASVQQTAQIQQSVPVQYAPAAPAPVSENILFNLNCSDVSCSNEDINIPPDLITYFVKEKKIKILYSKKVTSKYFKFYFDSTKDFYNYLKSTKGVKNEENFNSFATDKLTNQGG